MALYDLLHCQTPARLTLVSRPGSVLAAYPPPEDVNTWGPPLRGAWPMPEMTKLCSSWDTASCEKDNCENRGMLVMLPNRHGARTHARREQGRTLRGDTAHGSAYGGSLAVNRPKTSGAPGHSP